MPSGLRNTFNSQIGRNLEAYMDDIVIRSKKEANLLFDLRRSGLRLNPEKCTFGVCSGKLLGYLVSQRGIKANPEKIRVIQKMPPPLHHA